MLSDLPVLLLFQYLIKSKTGIFTEDIKWNFTKFLVNKQGEVVNRYAPTTAPQKIEKDIKQVLAE